MERATDMTGRPGAAAGESGGVFAPLTTVFEAFNAGYGLGGPSVEWLLDRIEGREGAT